jgi:hypothetical protein
MPEVAMNERARRWGRRLLWVLPALLLAYSVASLADFAWFRARIPIGFRDANWSGGWESTMHGGISGRLLVRLPDPLPEGEDFKVEVLVYYPIYSLWKTGQFVKMDFVGHFRPGEAASAGPSRNAIPGGGGLLKFKGAVGHQVVEYVALIDDGRTRIVGGYLSSDPYDYGHFAIRYY